jgi:4-amino-4-deoxy-L-arabinose transferase-like glycosyltransferase
LVVDAVPADQRPYIGSSSDNTVMELIIGHNGLKRLFGGGGGAAAAKLAPDAGDNAGAGLQPPANAPQGASPQAGPANYGQGFAGPRGDQGPAGGGGAFSFETGEAGLARFFEAPLAKEMSWLLPFALLGLGLALFAAPLRLPVSSRAHMAALLWGGWLLTSLVFFSLAGFFHAYYMVMLVPALGALVGIGGTLLWRLAQRRRLLAAGLLLVTSTVTVLFQLYLANALGVAAAWLWLPWLLLAGALALFFTALLPEVDWRRWALPAFALALAAMLVTPAAWSWLTVFEGNDANLPAAYSGESAQAQGRPNAGGERKAVNEELLDYLQANTEGMTYLMAVESSMQGASYVIETGRGVFYMGGFNGGDPVVDAADLAALVAEGELRYVMSGGRQRGGQQGVSQWLASACTPLPEYSQLPQANLGDDGGPPGQVNQGTILYDCGN